VSVAVIIGGGGGIGTACARALAHAGKTVVVADLVSDRAAELADDLGGHAISLDIANDQAVQDSAARIERDIGPVDVLVNSAALFQAPAPPKRLKIERWDAVVQICQRAVYTSCLAFGEAMIARGNGSIVNIASVAGMISFPLHAYGPAKAAVINMTANLAVEWGPSGVRVNSVSPGFTNTPAVSAAIRDGSRDVAPRLSATPLGRLVEPAEVASAVAFLASSAASAITGINLPVDCGWLAGATWAAYGGLRTQDLT
jgi:NAD(P)-dependent dehydrogenase (short-subunit alcohol dehydrogenase family)